MSDVVEGVLCCGTYERTVVLTLDDGTEDSVIPPSWDGQRVYIVRETGHSREWVLIERVRS